MTRMDWVLFVQLVVLALGAAGAGAFTMWLWYDPLRAQLLQMQRRALAAEEALAAARALELRYVADEEHAIR